MPITNIDASGWTTLRHPSVKLLGPFANLTVAQLAWEKAERHPDRTALIFEDGSHCSYREIAYEAAALCRALEAMRLEPGDTVSFQLPNWREAVAINLACAALGLIVNPISPIYRGAELRFMLKDARSKVIFIPTVYRSTDYVELLEVLRADLTELQRVITVRGDHKAGGYDGIIEQFGGNRQLPRLVPIEPDAVKLLMYTSGTTGAAKGALHTHRSIVATHEDYAEIWSVTGQDIMLMPSPITHGTGYILGMELPFFTDAAVAFMDRWEPAGALAYIDRVKATLCAGATVFLKDLVEEAKRSHNDIPSLRLFICGGASIPPDLIYQADAVTQRCRATRVYGSTEAPLVTKGSVGADQLGDAAETDGRISAFSVKIVDFDGNPLPSDHVGEILLRGAPLMVGYTSSEETAAAFDAEGYFRSGDLGYVTAENALVLTGRRKELIIRGGENLSPREIEEALLRHEAIREVAIVAMPHPRLGEAVCAYVVVRDGAEAPSLMDLIEHLERLGLARQKFPERLEYVEAFPRTSSGKIRKDILRAALTSSLHIHHTK